MAILTRKMTVYQCERCGYEWLPRFRNARPPAVCPNPKCKSPYWNKPRQRPAPAKRPKARNKPRR